MNVSVNCGFACLRTAISRRTAVFVLILFVGFGCDPIRGQESLTGVVTNSGTGRTLEGARVAIKDTNRETITDAQGTYRIDNVAAGSVTLTVSYTGLSSLDVPVLVSAGVPNRHNIELTSEIYTMSKFVVAGEREGNAQAITLQRLSGGVKSIVSADAFGGLAGNPADLAMRLPGVEGESVGGDYRYLRIRGMSQNLSTITQDGNRIADAASGGATREYQFQTVGADSIERMEVVKSPTPDMDGDSIGGAVNLVSKSAFDSSPERRIRGSIGGIWRASDERDKPRPNYSLSYSEVFGGRLGVAVNLAYRPHGAMLDQSSQAYEQKPLADQTGPAYQYSLAVQDFRNVRVRSGAGIKLDYKLSDSVRFFANWQYNKHVEHEYDSTATFSTGQLVATRDAAGNFTNAGGILPGYTDTTTQVRAVPTSQIAIAAFNGYKEGETSTITVGGVHRYRNLSIDYDVYGSLSKANYAGNNTLTYTLKNIGFTITKDDNLFPSVVQTAGPDWLNLNNYTDNAYTSTRNVGWDKYTGAQFNSKKKFETVVPTYIKAGYRYREQTRDLRNTTIRTVYVGPDGVMGPNPATGVNDDNLAQFGQLNRPFPDTNLKKYPNFPYPMKQAAGTDFNILTRNPAYFQEQIAVDIQGELTGNQNFTEKINAYYVMGNVDLGKLSVMGGVRVERTDTVGEGALQVITPEEKARRAAWVGVVTDAETRRRNLEEYGRRQTRLGSYRTVFPGVHLRYSPTRNIVSRLSYATNVGRPSIGQLIPRTTVNYDNQSVSSSNPSLQPQSANNFDLTTEYYFEPAGQFTVGFFLKEIKNFIYTAAGQQIGTGPDNGFDGDYAGYSYSTQRNGGFAKVKGIEIAYSQQFTFLPGFWSGFGVYSNLTRMQAEGNYGTGVTLGASLAPTPKIAGFNPLVGNIGISYIRNRVSLRGSLNYRGRYLSGYNANESRATYLHARPAVDLKTLFHLSKRFDVYLDVVNVTDIPDRYTEFGYGRPNLIQWLHPQLFFGVNARL